MQKRMVYKCAICGNEVELLEVGGGTLVCCGQSMNLMEENTTDAATEKHVPVIEKTKYGYKVKVGEVEHPMTADHYIRWVELHTKERVYRKELSPEDKPEVEFCCCAESCDAECDCGCEGAFARIECNLHGVWKSN